MEEPYDRERLFLEVNETLLRSKGYVVVYVDQNGNLGKGYDVSGCNPAEQRGLFSYLQEMVEGLTATTEDIEQEDSEES